MTNDKLGLTGVVIEFVDRKDKTTYTAYVKEMPEAIVEADSENEAKHNLSIALEKVLEFKRKLRNESVTSRSGVKNIEEFSMF